jgi:hypothetical protein
MFKFVVANCEHINLPRKDKDGKPAKDKQGNPLVHNFYNCIGTLLDESNRVVLANCSINSNAQRQGVQHVDLEFYKANFQKASAAFVFVDFPAE